MAESRPRPRWSAGFRVVVGMVAALVACVFLVPRIAGTSALDFDPARWREHDGNDPGPSPRYRMVGDLLRSHRLLGMTRPEVEALLGPVEYEGPDASPAWDLGQVESPVTLPHGATLRVQFGPDGRVWTVEAPGFSLHAGR